MHKNFIVIAVSIALVVPYYVGYETGYKTGKRVGIVEERAAQVTEQMIYRKVKENYRAEIKRLKETDGGWRDIDSNDVFIISDDYDRSGQVWQWLTNDRHEYLYKFLGVN